ncbi:MAG: chorismate synthase [Lachnospiraceae bacterium]|nr:chorismate synthase [Lachnospiraceae bacterium]
MAGSVYGTNFRITTWGESHGKALGVVIDGCPAGLTLNEADIQSFLDRRKPGQSKYTTARAEGDEVEILSGVFEGKTTGTPISLIIYNRDQHSRDYSEIASYYRPGHADYTFDEKYGFRDYRGGGRSSGRETAGRVAAGAVAAKALKELGIGLLSYTRSIGNISIDDSSFNASDINENPLYMPDREAAKRAASYLDELRAAGDSAGGVVECIIKGMPAGIGETVFDKLDAELGKAVMSIGAVKAFEIGDGIRASESRGSENNDPFIVSSGNPGQIIKRTNHSGGVLGGMSDGSDIILRAHFKPTPSISMSQDTVNKSGEEISVNIKGRHDPVIVPRAVVVVESMAAVTLLDLLIRNMGVRMDHLKKIYAQNFIPDCL